MATKHATQILVSKTDHARLTALAVAASSRLPEMADELLFEMEIARIAPEGRMPSTVVRMGSTVRYRDGAGALKQVTLVYPEHADISEGRISVLTPLGTALIGLAQGRSVSWTSRDGRRLSVEIVDVLQDQTAWQV